MSKESIKKAWDDLKEEVTKTSKKFIEDISNMEAFPQDTSKVTRVEIIDEKGRSYVNWQLHNLGTVYLSFQDQGRTLKIFINSIKP